MKDRGSGGKENFFLKKVSLPPRKCRKSTIKENPRRGFSLFPCFAKEFTLSCVFGRIIMGLLAPNPRKFFEKNLTKNFQTGVCANIVRTINQRTNKQKILSPASRFLKDRGCGGKENFFLKKVSFPPRKTKHQKTKKQKTERSKP